MFRDKSILRIFAVSILVNVNFVVDSQDLGPSSTTTNQAWNQTYVDILKKDLLAKYDKYARPSHHLNKTNIEMKLTLKHVDISEEKSIISVYGWMYMEWNDDKLKWNPDDYGGLKVIRIGQDELWKPDIYVFNGAKGADVKHFGPSNVLVHSTGSVIWVPPAELTAFCNLDMRLWPYDEQKCSLILGSWTYDGYKINLKQKTDSHEVDLLVKNNEWDVKLIVVKRNEKFYSCCAEPYIDVQYNFTLVRRSSMYRSVFVNPASVIILVTLANFWISNEIGAKLVINGILSVIICMYLLYFATKLPVMAGNTPVIVTFYSTTLVLIALSSIISIVSLNLSTSKLSLPSYLKDILNHKITSYLLLTSNNDDEEEKDKNEWKTLALVIDRLTFLVYCVIFMLLGASCL